jgi:arylsulfatase A-like enzyme
MIKAPGGNNFVLMTFALMVCAVVTGCEQQAQTSPTDDRHAARPNILLIVADDLGYTDIGAFGSEMPTPNLDALAHEGIRFTNLHTASWCQPTRVMMMTGSGGSALIEEFPRLPTGNRNNVLRLEWATLPELLHESGYQTFMTGKWDLGLEGEYRPPARGFDRSFALLEGAASHFAEPFWRQDDTTYYEDDGRRLSLTELPDDFYSTEFYTSRMLDYLQSRDPDRPWFAYLSYTAPHWPLQVPEDWLDRHAGRYDAGYDDLRARRMSRAADLGVIPGGARPDLFAPVAPAWSELSPELQEKFARAEEIYASMIEYMDMSIGRIVQHLEVNGELDNTVIFFLADHGASAGEHGIGVARFPIESEKDNRLENFGRRDSFIDKGIGFAEAATAPVRYYKGSAFEGGVRAAAFVRYPGLADKGGTNSSLVSAMDLLPTFLEIAGSEHPGPSVFRGREIHGIRGRSMWQELQTGVPSDRSDYEIGWIRGAAGALVRGRYKVINQPPPNASAVASDGGGATTAWRLYDIAADPSETRDIAADRPDIVDSLIEAWESDWK